jgi:hypothetical protein
MVDLQISPLEVKDRHLLEKGLLSWSSKNNSESSEHDTKSLVTDMFEASDTTIFKLHICTEVIGVFYIVETQDCLEISGGLLKLSGGAFNTYYVLSFCKEWACARKIPKLMVTVIKSHYKYETLIRYYQRYGFHLANNRNHFVDLILHVA